MSEGRVRRQIKRLRSGFARIEFVAIAKRAEELMAMGHTIQSAYEELRKEKKITMTYDSFRRHLNQRRKNRVSPKDKEEKIVKSVATQGNKPKIIANKQAAFDSQSSLDESNLV